MTDDRYSYQQGDDFGLRISDFELKGVFSMSLRARGRRRCSTRISDLWNVPPTKDTFQATRKVPPSSSSADRCKALI